MFDSRMIFLTPILTSQLLPQSCVKQDEDVMCSVNTTAGSKHKMATALSGRQSSPGWSQSATSRMSCSVCFDKWLLSVNVEKSAILVLRSPCSDPVDLHIELHGSRVPQVSTHRHLGVTLNSSLT